LSLGATSAAWQQSCTWVSGLIITVLHDSAGCPVGIISVGLAVLHGSPAYLAPQRYQVPVFVWAGLRLWEQTHHLSGMGCEDMLAFSVQHRINQQQLPTCCSWEETISGVPSVTSLLSFFFSFSNYLCNHSGKINFIKALTTSE